MLVYTSSVVNCKMNLYGLLVTRSILMHMSSVVNCKMNQNDSLVTAIFFDASLL